VARNTEQRTNELVRWVFRGFWRGQGEVRFTGRPNGIVIEGYEEITIRWLFFLSPLVERLSLNVVSTLYGKSAGIDCGSGRPQGRSEPQFN
jgi:hypothetical protein